MTSLRRRIGTLTCVGTLTLSLGGLATGPSAATTVSASSTVPATSLAQLRQTHPGLDRLLSGAAAGSGRQRAIVSFDAVPTGAEVAALRRLGLVVQPMRRLPLALVEGSLAQVVASVTSGVGNDVHPDDPLTYLDTASSDVMSSSLGAAQDLRARGLTGKGVTVGVIDSGCDGTHPDLADHISHNVTLLSPEYVNAGTSPTIVVPVDRGPYVNTDLGSGHGTHVAGIIAADGHTGPDHLGVAPDATLACFAIGAVITTTAVVTAFDYILDQPGHLSIDVINNSWGNSFRQYDPSDPVNVATRAISRRGIVTVFAAGNSGAEEAEASVSPFNQAPWVISVAASDLDRVRGGFSSNGLAFDNGAAKPIGQGGHTVFVGDRIGNTQPDVSAPGVDISSTCDGTGTVIGPCAPGENASASGTSMASPHVAGAAAVLRQANPRLTYQQVRTALTATASRMRTGTRVLPSWQVGYGHVNLDRAVALVRSPRYAAALRTAQERADRRLRTQDRWAVTRADLWQEASPPVSVGGSFTRTYPVTVGRATDALKVAIVYPTPGTAANLASVTGTVRDAAGRVVARTTTDVLYATGLAHVMVPRVRPGRYTVEVVGDYLVSDPDTVDSDSVNGRVVLTQVAQLRRRR
ncbi:S8 family peptidase [Nocardioides rubriscoriae]|uniref:S8 family peptidase n=1 Tax=Nocardioides rubriscoriae TaxID=642762 RepID=UPI0011DFE917|nr:S8 family serine peptidase [Nocardioides rubriscoriae]